LTQYLIDTNVASEMRKPKPHGGVLAWLESLELGQGFFAAVTFGEIQKGIEITRRQDPLKAAEIEAWALELEQTSQVLAMTAALGRMEEFGLHAASAPNAGVTDDEIDELLFQIVAYCGVPAGVAARRAVREVRERRQA
jgi:hypothetical protein